MENSVCGWHAWSGVRSEEDARKMIYEYVVLITCIFIMHPTKKCIVLHDMCIGEKNKKKL